MAALTTLLAYAEQQLEHAETAKQAAQTAIAETQRELSEARQAHDQATEAFATFVQNAVDIRKQLATIVTPADGNVLIDALE